MKKYNIGLDIGTTSVGWAVTEVDNQKIFRKGNKRLWGVRLFEEAKTALDRRTFRNTRRRYDRRRWRIKLLQDEFRTEINKKDSQFFRKLQESFYHDGDLLNKTIKITEEEKKQIKKYNEEFKTIYHLRNKLINSDEKVDIRLVYLAIHHIIKYRGNFLYGIGNFSVNNLNILEKLQEVFTNTFDSLNIEIDLNNIDYKRLEQAICNVSKNDRKILIKECLDNYLPKEFNNEFIKLINGNRFNFIKMISLDVVNDKVDLSFNGTEYDDKYLDFAKILGEYIGLLDQYKELYNMIFLKRLFEGSDNTNISSLMVEKYNLHKKDLKFLKELLKNNRKIYNKFFKTKKDVCVYEKYIKNKISNAEFVNELKKYLPELLEEIDNQSLIKEYEMNVQYKLDNGIFLPRITDNDNGKYPYQLNKEELIKIINNQGKHYSFLLNKTSDSEYKLVKLLEFKIPYYVGPLTNEKNSQFAWMIRKKEGKITPYNFDEIIDKNATAEKFIKRMISNCSYLLKEPAIPNNSILYSKYKVLNELKQIKINDRKLDNKTQHYVYKELFKKYSGTITDKVFKEFIYRSKEFDMYGTDIKITGYSDENRFANSMQSYVDFFGESGIFENTDYTIDDAENIIEWITIFEDKDILKTKLKKEYPKLDSHQLKVILNKKYKGWSSLSKKLLTLKYYFDKKTNESKSIMDLMWDTNDNFMQILFDEKYKFQKMISDINNINIPNRIDYELVDSLATSPAIKRGIYQTLKIVDEIVNYIGYQPELITIEMPRGDDNKKQRKDNRKNQLIKLYESIKDEINDYKALYSQLKDADENITQKLFLYFIQEGRSLYTGTRLKIEELDSYEIDHIIPRTLIKDDSIDNKALVLRKENQEKGASYVLPERFRNDYNRKWWQKLKKIGLISAKKYNNLVRRTYSDEDIQGFINRQLVETRQITKHVANILEKYYNDSKVIYLKANLSHNYREAFDLFKFRQINNYHHAHDAYLAAVLGEYKEKHFKRKINFEIIRDLNSKLLANEEYKKFKQGFIINSLDPEVNIHLQEITNNIYDEKTGEIIFDTENFNKKIENTLYCNDIIISKKVEFRTGEFYNQTKNIHGKKGVPLKKNLSTNLYGSYTSLNPAYAKFVKYTHKGKNFQKLIGIPIYIVEKMKNDVNCENLYIKELLKLKDTDKLSILNKKIPFFSLFNLDNQICYLVGANDKVEICNAKEFHFTKEIMKNNKHALNRLLNNKNGKITDLEYEESLENIINYIINKIEKDYVLYQNLVSEIKTIIHFETITNNTLKEKEQIVIQLLNLLKCNSTTANFKFLNEKNSSSFGRKNGKTISHAKLITKSITGIKEQCYEF